LKKVLLARLACIILVLSMLVTLVACSSGKADTVDSGSTDAVANVVEEPDTTSDVSDETNVALAFQDAIDTDWAYDLAVEISEGAEYRDNSLGDRLAGSDAEHRTADKIQSVMEEIGLTDVTKYGVTVDKIQIGDSYLTLEDGTEIVIHPYQTEGIAVATEIVDVGDGTMWDYEELDVEGKIVLIDIDQRENWWIGTPAIQALNNGAVAVLANNVSGFSEIATDAYNANDFCGPAEIPTASITQDDAELLREYMVDGEASVTLVIDNEYEKDGGTAYNVVGKIEGSQSGDESIIFGAHYDAYFSGFQDDTIAWTGVLAIAKAMIESGYVPNRDIYFICHAAEEWGQASTAFDWAQGAYSQTTEISEEWAGTPVAFINFELPAYQFADYTYTLSAPESYGLLAAYTYSEYAPEADEIYSEGVFTDGYLTYTYADDFSYYISGVPSYINGMMTDLETEDVFDFYYEYYHTNYDTKDTYDEAVFKFNLDYYGGLGIYIDSIPALTLDFTYQAQRLADSIDEALAADEGADVDAFFAAVDEFAAFAEALNAQIEDVNARFEAANGEEKSAIWEEALVLNEANLSLFQKSVDYFVGLSEETPIVPHEWFQNNIYAIDETIFYLLSGDVVTAADETAWAINGVGEWYSMNFDEATVELDEGSYLGAHASQNWGTNRIYEYADVEAATRSLVERYEEEDGDFSEEIEIYSAARERQAELYVEFIALETANIYDLTG